MRFSIANLLWLTLLAAFVSGVSRLLGAEIEAILGLWLGAAFVFAPLVLALVSSVFPKIEVQTRRRAGYAVLLALLMSCLLAGAGGWLVTCVVGLLWVTQLDVYEHVHASPERCFERRGDERTARVLVAVSGGVLLGILLGAACLAIHWGVAGMTAAERWFYFWTELSIGGFGGGVAGLSLAGRDAGRGRSERTPGALVVVSRGVLLGFLLGLACLACHWHLAGRNLAER